MGGGDGGDVGKGEEIRGEGGISWGKGGKVASLTCRL
jgi:hypothetical protein